MKNFYLLICAFLIIGCGITQQQVKDKLPTVLTSENLQWTIPAGTLFKAIQKPTYPTLTEFSVPNDLVVLHKGNLIELEKEANRKAIKGARRARMNGMMWGIMGTFMTALAGAAGKKVFDWKRKENG